VRDDERRMEPGRLLNSFMRFVESVRRNCTVSSLAQSSDSGCDDGTGFRRGTRLRLLSAMAAIVVWASLSVCSQLSSQ
jgi:hypothetical protein